MNTDFNEVCRLCLRFCEQYVDLNQTNEVKTLANDLVEKIKYCYVVQIDLSEGLPTKICYECIQVLSFFYAAKKNVLVSEQLLRDILFVRKKLEEETQNYENMMIPDIIEIKQNNEEIKQTLNVDVEKSNENINTVMDAEIICSECDNISQINGTPIVEVDKGNTVTVIDESPISVFDDSDSRLKDRNKLVFKKNGRSDLRKLSNSIDDIETSVNLKHFKRRGRPSKSMKVELEKMSLGLYPHSKENVKEIGTVIDTRNILSPNVKRSRKI